MRCSYRRNLIASATPFHAYGKHHAPHTPRGITCWPRRAIEVWPSRGREIRKPRRGDGTIDTAVREAALLTAAAFTSRLGLSDIAAHAFAIGDEMLTRREYLMPSKRPAPLCSEAMMRSDERHLPACDIALLLVITRHHLLIDGAL